MTLGPAGRLRHATDARIVDLDGDTPTAVLSASCVSSQHERRGVDLYKRIW